MKIGKHVLHILWYVNSISFYDFLTGEAVLELKHPKVVRVHGFGCVMHTYLLLVRFGGPIMDSF